MTFAKTKNLYQEKIVLLLIWNVLRELGCAERERVPS